MLPFKTCNARSAAGVHAATGLKFLRPGDHLRHLGILPARPRDQADWRCCGWVLSEYVARRGRENATVDDVVKAVRPGFWRRTAVHHHTQGSYRILSRCIPKISTKVCTVVLVVSVGWQVVQHLQDQHRHAHRHDQTSFTQVFTSVCTVLSCVVTSKLCDPVPTCACTADM